ncbi:MAG TPA: NAD(P)/FAD-dependent oxidoreductase [Methylomirabilota bacterium]|jgi:geranylgeranyl reductase family protein|nr:NAD(P)/FAD-dependent oxidoreductase [Methylomirabilota bacterium]
MTTCDVLVVGGGPAGSTCAWQLRASGVDVLVIDKARFPRDKVCAGWITPAVVDELSLDVDEYRRGRVFQGIAGFRTGVMGEPLLDTRYDRPVSFGILRREFDHYLLVRSGARVLEGTAVTRIERTPDGWQVNGDITARLLIGAGGHFCPIARRLNGPRRDEPIVAASEVEFTLTPEQQAACRVNAELPELYFCPDLKGYGWCFRKETTLNVGLGRQDRHRLTEHLQRFVRTLVSEGHLPADLPTTWHGHAYLLNGSSPRAVTADGVLLIGDAAGLAYAQSGEGIRPAIESGLLAARTIIAAGGDGRGAALDPYRVALQQRFGVEREVVSSAPVAAPQPARGLTGLFPDRVVLSLARRLMATRWFTRRVVLDRWFLHAGDAPLARRLQHG